MIATSPILKQHVKKAIGNQGEPRDHRENREMKWSRISNENRKNRAHDGHHFLKKVQLFVHDIYINLYKILREQLHASLSSGALAPPHDESVQVYYILDGTSTRLVHKCTVQLLEVDDMDWMP